MQNTTNWDEFDWERELRKDDERINGYLNELSKFIDVPGEEDIILKSLQNHSKPIPQNINLTTDNEFVSENGEDPDMVTFTPEEWRKKDNAIIYTIVEKMASQWSIFMASRLVPKNMTQGMRIVCYFGKLLARISDILNIGVTLPTPLRIALCKRVTTTVNELLAELAKISELQNDMDKEIGSHLRRLQIVREKVIDILEKLRQEKGDKSNK